MPKEYKKNPEKIKEDMDKMLKRHGKTLRKALEKYGEEEFNKKLQEIIDDKNQE